MKQILSYRLVQGDIKIFDLFGLKDWKRLVNANHFAQLGGDWFFSVD